MEQNKLVRRRSSPNNTGRKTTDIVEQLSAYNTVQCCTTEDTLNLPPSMWRKTKSIEPFLPLYTSLSRPTHHCKTMYSSLLLRTWECNDSTMRLSRKTVQYCSEVALVGEICRRCEWGCEWVELRHRQNLKMGIFGCIRHKVGFANIVSNFVFILWDLLIQYFPILWRMHRK